MPTAGRWQSAEESPEASLEFETLISDLSSRFINLPPGEVDREILDAQRRVCECLGIDLSVLWQWAGDVLTDVALTHAYRPLGGQPIPERVNAREYFQWGTDQILAGSTVLITDVEQAPAEAAPNLKGWRHFGVHAVITFPMSTGNGPVFGALNFSSMRGPRNWPDPLVKRLQLITQVFANALARKRADEALRTSEARLSEASELAGLGFYESDIDGGITFSDDRFAELCGHPREGRTGIEAAKFWMEHVHPDDRSMVATLREELFDGRHERHSGEYRYLHPVLGERWIHHLARVSARDATGRVARTYGVLRDITESRRREEALKQSYAEIERLKDRLQAESDYLRAEVRVAQPAGEITSQSPAMAKVLRLLEQVARTEATVLVCGETGSGKELVARAIHRLSPRHGRLMVNVNCAALPSGLVESELFGREKGAYTGALTRQVGRFEIADGSTLFLDEVGELSLEVQAKLLRVLERGEFERLGSPRTVKVDVRLIAATNRDLTEEVRKGRFREDLYYRLNVFPIRVPPLRERKEDIPLLVWAFLEEFCSRMGKKITQVPRRTMDALVRHSWPGNVRELRNAIEHGAIVTTGDTLRVPIPGEAGPAGAHATTLAEAERELILRTLETTGGRVKGPKGAASALGLNPSTLYSRMKKLGIRPPGPENADPPPKR